VHVAELLRRAIEERARTQSDAAAHP